MKKEYNILWIIIGLVAFAAAIFTFMQWLDGRRNLVRLQNKASLSAAMAATTPIATTPVTPETENSGSNGGQSSVIPPALVVQPVGGGVVVPQGGGMVMPTPAQNSMLLQ